MSNYDKAFLAGSHISKTRYIYQVTAAAIYGLQMEALLHQKLMMYKYGFLRNIAPTHISSTGH